MWSIYSKLDRMVKKIKNLLKINLLDLVQLKMRITRMKKVSKGGQLLNIRTKKGLRSIGNGNTNKQKLETLRLKKDKRSKIVIYVMR